MIVFKKLRYKNFLSTGDKFTEIDLNSNSHTLIVGQNGSGKSTMLDALSFALFGKPHRNINKIQLINSVNNKGLQVEIEFEIGNKQYKVIRGYKPVKFEIYVDGTMINQNSHNKEYQKVLESNILKFTHKTFHQVVVLGSSSFIPFMQLGAYHRRDVIEDLLDIGVFSKMNTILKEKNASLKEKINQVLHAIEINETKTDAQKKYIRDISKINNDVKKQKEDLISETFKTNQQLVETNAENQSLASAISSEVTPLLQTRRDTIASHTQSETETLTTIKTLVKEHKFYEKNETCPTCSQDISHELKIRKLEDSKIKANELQSHLSQVRSQREESLKELNELEVKMQQVNDLQQQVNVNLSTITANNALMEKAKAEIESLSNNQSDLSMANDDYDALISEYHELVGGKNTLNDQAAYNSVISEMLKDTGIKTKIIKQYLPVINQLVNQYLQILDFYVHFDLDESFQETIRSRHRDAFSYESFSEGEKQRIDLSLLFTWRQVAKMKNSISTNLLVLDETFDSSLDEAGIENLMKIIHTLDSGTNVFIISHKTEELEGKFEKKIEFVKEKNFSKMKVAA